MKIMITIALLQCTLLLMLPQANAQQRAYPAKDVQAKGWLNISGPLGNFQRIPSDTLLLEHLTLAELAWTSEVDHYGAGKAIVLKLRNAEETWK